MESFMAKPRLSKEFRNFTATIDKLLTVPRATVERRIAEHREQAAQNPRKRGPKPKATSASASDRDDA
jgi:hypothetical protein